MPKPIYDFYRVGVRDEQGQLIFVTDETADLQQAVAGHVALRRELRHGHRAELLVSAVQTQIDPAVRPCSLSTTNCSASAHP
jgi:hypothetical protein